MLEFSEKMTPMNRIMTPHFSALALAIALLSPVAEATAQTSPVVVGGAGSQWGSEGDIPAIVIRSATTVEATNSPGGVIDFSVEGRDNWVFPQKVDTTQNIMVTLSRRAGTLTTPTFGFRDLQPLFGAIADNDGDTALELRGEPGQSANAFGLIIQIDLGAIFGLTRIKFFPRNADPDFPAPLFPFQKDFLKGFEIFVNDGAPENERDNILIFENLEEGFRGQNEDAIVDLRFDPRFVRYLRLKSLTNTDFEIAELQIFARGFVPEATYISNVFEFDEPSLLGNIRWVAEQEGDSTLSSMQVRTRTGVDQLPVVYPRVGLQASGRIELQFVQGGARAEEIPIEALWKRAEDVEDDDLRSIVEDVLDNAAVDGREALLFFSELPLAQRLALEIDQDYYDDVADAEKRNLKADLTNWSPWSAPYSVDGIVAGDSLGVLGLGVPITSPSPRRYFQFMVDFDNRAFDSATGLGGISFDVSAQAFTDSLIAEILPRTAVTGQRSSFTYAVLNRPGPNGIGFDQLEIDTPLRTSAVGRVIMSQDGAVVQEADFTGNSLDDEALPLTDGAISISEVRDDGFIISFPRVNQESMTITVEFENAILRFGTQFTARARNASDVFVGQSVIPGNAADLSTADLDDPDVRPVGTLNPANLVVVVPITRNLLVNVKADPPVLTPNGDDVNDVTDIRYDITNIAEPTDVDVKIFDLSGRLIKSETVARRSGRFSFPWDGSDNGDNLVPPGNYIFSVSMDAGATVSESVGVVAVAY
jgi:gliding motility-associated-like protein